MGNFTSIILEANHGTTAAPSWVTVGPTALHSIRWSDLATQKNVSASIWPTMVRPLVAAQVSYTYAYTADAVGDGLYADGGNCPAYTKANYLWARWSWDNTGTFASAPILTAFNSSAHGYGARGSGGLIEGSADTMPVATAYSYLKGNAFGRVDSAGAPAAAPANAPVITSGTAGSVAPTAGANWLANYQSLFAINDYITAPFTPVATTADKWSIHFSLFVGPNMTPASYACTICLLYSWT